MAFPVEEKIDDIRRALAANRDVVLTAPPGSGKTTCVPPALLDEPWLAGKKIVMLEPRRLAARTCAQFIASKLGEPVGATVGYQVRLGTVLFGERPKLKAVRASSDGDEGFASGGLDSYSGAGPTYKVLD